MHIVKERAHGADGKALRDRLVEIDKTGEQELKKYPLARFFTLIKRLFIFSERENELEEITQRKADYYSSEAYRRSVGIQYPKLEEYKKISKHEEIANYADRHKGLIIQELAQLGWHVNAADISFAVSQVVIKGNLNVQGDPLFLSPALALNYDLSTAELFQQMLNEFKLVLPRMLELKALLKPWYEEDRFNKAITDAEAWQINLAEIQRTNVNFAGSEVKVEFEKADADQLNIHFKWKALLGHGMATNRSMEIATKKILTEPDAIDFDDLWDNWSKDLNKNLKRHLFQEFVIPEADIGLGLFGGRKTPADQQKELIKQLQILEELMEFDSGTLVNLLEKNPKELDAQLKKLKGKAGLKFHPDKAGEESTAKFQEFGKAHEEALRLFKNEDASSQPAEKDNSFNDAVGIIEKLLKRHSLLFEWDEEEFLVDEIANLKKIASHRFKSDPESQQTFDAAIAVIEKWLDQRK